MSVPPSPRSHNSAVDLTLVEEISRSIFSNLDRDALLNSIVTLLRQLFGFPTVGIYTTRGEDKLVLRRTRISSDGLEPEVIYYAEQDNGPVGWCISHLEPVVVNEINADRRFSIAGSNSTDQAALILPLHQGDSFIGVLELCASTANAFAPESVQLFALLADKIATAIQNANLYHLEHVRRSVSERLQNVAGLLSVDLSMRGTCDRLLDELPAYVPFDACAIWLINTLENEGSGAQVIPSFQLAGIKCADPSDCRLIAPYLQNSDETRELIERYPWVDEVIGLKMPAVRNKASAFEPLGGLLNYDPSYSGLAVPLLIHDVLSGVLVCACHAPDQYNGEYLSIAQTFANYGAIAIENSRLYQVAHDQAWISTVLLQVAESTQSITNLDDLIEAIANMLPGLIGADACAIFLWDPSVETFYWSASSGFDEEQTERFKSWYILPGSVQVFEDIKENRSPVILDRENISTEVSSIVLPGYDLDNELLILFPLATQRFLSGVILVDFSNSDLYMGAPQETWDEKYTLIEGVARQSAFAIENLQLIRAQEEEAYISVALLQVAQAVVSLSQLEEVLATIVRLTPILVGVKRGIIYIWDNKGQIFRQSQNYGFSKNDLAMIGQEFRASEFPIVEAIQQRGKILISALRPEATPGSWSEITSGECHVVEDTNPDNDEIAIRLDVTEVNARDRLLIGFPLSMKSEILGAMLIEEEDPTKGSPSTHIREKRIEIVKGITQQAAIAIKNEQLQQDAVESERMERELQLAREIQAAFLPDKLPDLPEWDIDVCWQPAREVGGDFYDFLYLEDHRIGFVIADVADKGMPAALFMTLIRTLIRAAAKEKSSPAAVLKQVNELLIPDAKQGVFVTVFFGVISLDSGSLVYANAGHNPPLIKRRDSDDLVELTRTAMALGIFSDIEVEEKVTLLNRDDWLLLYTDGITEAFSSQEVMFGTRRLFRLFTDGEYRSSNDLVGLITHSVNEFIQGKDLSDDITLVAIHREAQ